MISVFSGKMLSKCQGACEVPSGKRESYRHLSMRPGRLDLGIIS